MIFDLELLRKTQGSNAKLALLKEACEKNPTLAEFLKICYSYDKVFGVNEKTLDKVCLEAKFKEASDQNIEEIYLTLLTKGRRVSYSELLDVANKSSKADFEFLERILCKDLKSGCAIGTIKKIAPNLKTFDTQAASSNFSEADFENQQYIVEPKLDGVRCIALIENGVVDLFSRNGKKIRNFSAIEAELLKLFPGNQRVMLDGELLCGKNLFNQLMSTLYSLEPKEGIVKNTSYNVFDILPLEDFKDGRSAISLRERKEKLARCVGKSQQRVKTVDYFTVVSQQETMDKFNGFVEEGYEGLMLKDLNSCYRFKRTKDWIKVKPSEDYTIVITSIAEGSGKYKGSLGSFHGYYLEDESITTDVGSGFSDEERARLWSLRDELIGKKIDIQSDMITETKSFRFPVFKRFREDI